MEGSDFSCSFFIGFDSSSSRRGPLYNSLSGQAGDLPVLVKERTYMPGSKTTQGRTGTRFIAPVRVAFRYANSVGTLN